MAQCNFSASAHSRPFPVHRCRTVNICSVGESFTTLLPFNRPSHQLPLMKFSEVPIYYLGLFVNSIFSLPSRVLSVAGRGLHPAPRLLSSPVVVHFYCFLPPAGQGCAKLCALWWFFDQSLFGVLASFLPLLFFADLLPRDGHRITPLHPLPSLGPSPVSATRFLHQDHTRRLPHLFLTPRAID